MGELSDTVPPDNPMSAARRGARPALRRRFYDKAAAIATADGHAVTLDDKPVRTPARRPLAAPTATLAAAIAAEWQAQHDIVDPARMPLTRLANAVIDGVADAPGPVAAEIEKYLGSDLLFYRADAPRPLSERQARHWDAILNWASVSLDANFRTGAGVIHIPQPEAALRAAAAAIPSDPWRLGAVHAITTLTGSALIALALTHGAIAPEAAWQAAHVDEDWNIEQWGKDALAEERRAFRFAEFLAATTVLQLLAGYDRSIPRKRASQP